MDSGTPSGQLAMVKRTTPMAFPAASCRGAPAAYGDPGAGDRGYDAQRRVGVSSDTVRQSAGRIAIAEPWAVLRRGLIGLLQGPYVVVGDLDDVAALVGLLGDRPVDLAVIGDTPGLDLVAAVGRILDVAPDVAVVVLCDDIGAADLTGVLRAGAVAVFAKAVPDQVLVEGIERALAGERVIDQRFLPLLFNADSERLLAGDDVTLLTRREREVLAHLARGETNREIADALVLGESTVKTHLRRIYAKLDVDDRHHAVGRALELGLLR